LMPLFNYLSFIILFLRLMIWKSVVDQKVTEEICYIRNLLN
jgi:hypothetical protein